MTHVTVKKKGQKGVAFARYAIALHVANGSPLKALAYAKSRKEWNDTPEVRKTLAKLINRW
jgi:hypothetical protein